MSWSRRRFVETLGAAALGTLLPSAWDGDGTPVIAAVGADQATEFGRGATLGMEEGRRSAGLLRRPLELTSVAAPEAGGGPALIDSLAKTGAVGVVLALGGPGHTEVEESAAGAGLIVLDARGSRPTCPPREGVFRTGLPERAYRHAVRVAGDPGRRAVLWDGGLFRYGAEQLNERYRRRFGAEMTGPAWAAWMAVKALTEAALRAGDGGRDALVERLGGRRAAFDGHKGTPLMFTAPGGTLAQPLYVIGREGTAEVLWTGEEEG